MAELRKSAKQTDARRRAREKAAQFRELQDTLEQLATDYFVATDSIEETNEEAEHEIAKLRERAEKQNQKARDEADDVIVRMVGAGASVSEVAARLGVQVRAIKKATKAPSELRTSDSSSSSSNTETSANEPADQGGEGARDAA